MSTGWISLHRKILDNPILARSRIYSRFEAFVYMLLKANHKDNKCVIGNVLVKVDKGSFITSQKKLMKQFRWSSSKLRGFLKLLESDNMIELKTNTTFTHLTIINYSSYQNLESAKETQKKRKRNTNEMQKKTNNNDIIPNNKINKKDRIINFYNRVKKEALELYSKEMIEKFCNYWTESNNTENAKLRFEREKVFNIQRRLKRWEMNNKNWSNDTTESDLDLVKKKEARIKEEQIAFKRKMLEAEQNSASPDEIREMLKGAK